MKLRSISVRDGGSRHSIGKESYFFAPVEEGSQDHVCTVIDEEHIELFISNNIAEPFGDEARAKRDLKLAQDYADQKQKEAEEALQAAQKAEKKAKDAIEKAKKDKEALADAALEDEEREQEEEKAKEEARKRKAEAEAKRKRAREIKKIMKDSPDMSEDDAAKEWEKQNASEGG